MERVNDLDGAAFAGSDITVKINDTEKGYFWQIEP